MDYYLDLTVLPDPEFTETMLLNALFAKFHRALVARKTGDIGVSFPKANKTLGSVLRLHGTQTALDELQQTPWMKGLRDYVQSNDIAHIPDGCKHQQVKRVHEKASPERMLRRAIRNEKSIDGIHSEQVKQHPQRQPKHPFLQLKSQSTGGHHFRLFIQHTEAQDEAIAGEFNCYGLSLQGSTVPKF